MIDPASLMLVGESPDIRFQGDALMKRHVFGQAAGILLVGLIGVAAAAEIERPPTQPVSGNISWVYDYDEGKELARQSGQPLLVVFRCER
jgi:hypothetical protein